MIELFIKVRILDIIDIFLVAFLMYQIYMFIRGSIAINIFFGLFAFYLLWLLVKALDMYLLSSILGQVIGVGVIALIIVFQQEIRRFLRIMGSRYMSNQRFSIEKLFKGKIKAEPEINIELLSDTSFHLANKKTGALIVLVRKNQLMPIVETGEQINAVFSKNLVESIFSKYSPLHDGAIIVKANRIIAARCVLPVTDKQNLPSSFGLRHRAALGLTENSDAIVIAISEENGYVSVSIGGVIERNISQKRLEEFLSNNLTEPL